MRGGVWAGLVAIVMCGLAAGPAMGALTERVSISTSGQQANGESADNGEFAISADGRYVAFTSDATNLVPDDTNGCRDIFVRDRLLGTTERASVSSVGVEGDAQSRRVAVSGDGRYVAFWSEATNLVPDDTNGFGDFFLRDRLLQATERVNVSREGVQANLPSGQVLKFSANGRYIAFSSCADNLVPADTNHQVDVFLRDLLLGTTERISLTDSGEPIEACSGGWDMSEDCRYLVFSTVAGNVVPGIPPGPQLWLRERVTNTLELVNLDGAGNRVHFDGLRFPIGGDGRYVAFRSNDASLTGNDGYYTQVYVRDRLREVTELVSVSPTGAMANYYCSDVALSADGRFVVFASGATNLVPGHNPYYWPQVFVRDRETGETAIISVGEGEDSLSWCEGYVTVSADGGDALFSSSAPNLAPPDENPFTDVFVRRLRGRFSDVPTYYWAYPSIEACAVAGVVSGYRDGSYRPFEQVDRAQMSVYLARALAEGDVAVPPHLGPATFPDVPTSHWAFKYVEYCHDSGVVGGYWDGTYRPDVTVDRAQMAAYTARAMAGGDSAVPAGPETPSFGDVPADHWAYKYVEYCRDNGVVGGYWDGYHPAETVTRAQMAVYVQRAFELPM